MKLLDYLEQLPPEARERLLGRIEGMTMAMRICRNRAEDVKDNLNRSMEAAALAEIIRMVQVQIGSARQLFGPLTEDELDEIRRIY